MAKTCSTCKYFHPTGHGTVEYDSPHCRRYPPIHIGPERTADGFPRVKPDTLRCGEYKKA